jgi:uncharacterized protein (DUF2132 family)
MKILIFTEGTIIMPKAVFVLPRDEIVKQVQNHKETVHDYASFIPIGNSVRKLNNWAREGVEIMYLTSHKKPDEVRDVQHVLSTHGFPIGQLMFRQGKESYSDIAEAVIPDILVEDDCESIGGSNQMTITGVEESIKRRIKSIVVKENGGIDYLPDDILSLLKL